VDEVLQSVYDGDIAMLVRFIRAGIDLNLCDYDNRTSLHVAATQGNISAVRVEGK
jgi:hypothetical protein